ncbi:DUF4365 domain-containing protein [Nocardiopsis sp. NPDC007018]|uniref:DUF4365 domain-containing protein n=1 Tax=Nocardiopsis sp. NPDC007018 TaxID=3155721 RepID=UPI0033E51100
MKGGVSWKRANGYAVPVRQHAATWSEGNVPVLCVVYDPDTGGLYWANATDQLRLARRQGEELPAIKVDPDDRLDEDSIDRFVARVRAYVGRFRGMRAVHTQLGEMAGVEFGDTDQVLHFVNVYEEVLIFWKRFGEPGATLLHSDLGWAPQHITAGDFGTVMSVPTIGDVVLNMSEALWLMACFQATEGPDAVRLP